MIASAERIGRLIGGRDLAALLQDDARQFQRDCAG
jgi:hypothetical protein